MRGAWLIGLLLAATSNIAATAGPPPTTLVGAQTLPREWETVTRTIFRTAVETPTVAGRGQVPILADYLALQLRGAGWSAADLHVIPYVAAPGNKTAALVARWPTRLPSERRPILILGHLDVVEALPGDWSTDPFKLVERDGYFIGRGTLDNKQGVVASTVALMKLRAAGFQPNRDIVLLFTGDEETMGKGAALGTTDWRQWTEAEFALNSDVGDGAFTAAGRSLGFALQTSEKTFQSYRFRVRNPGGHSSRPRPDNAIYQLADALKRLQLHRFAPAMNETTRAYFAARAAQEENSVLGDAIRAWLANPADGRAADQIEASETEVGLTRTRCVATMLSGGHADNALPQLAEAVVNCRIMPGVEPKLVEADLKMLAGTDVEVEPAFFAAKSSPVSPLRADVLDAFTRSVQVRFPGVAVVPQMSTGATDGMMFRASGIPVYGVNGAWGVSPDDERAHGKDERIPVQSLWDNVLHWERMVRSLAGGR